MISDNFARIRNVLEALSKGLVRRGSRSSQARARFQPRRAAPIISLLKQIFQFMKDGRGQDLIELA